MTWNWGSSTSGKMETAFGPSTHLYQISFVVKPTKKQRNPICIRFIDSLCHKEKDKLTAFDFNWAELTVQREILEVHGTRGRDCNSEIIQI